MVKAQESELISIYTQFLELMKNEKAAKESYLKSVIANNSKVCDIRSKLEKKPGHKFVIMIDLLKIYGEVLEKLQECIAGEVSYIEANFICKLAHLLKDNRTIKERMQNSIDLMHKYMKQLGKIESYKRSMFDSYHTYEKSTLIDDAINKVISLYAEDNHKKTGDAMRDQFASREFDYTTAVAWFNDEAPSMLKQNVDGIDIGVELEEVLDVYRKLGLHCQRRS